jgi:hypothetical protein
LEFHLNLPARRLFGGVLVVMPRFQRDPPKADKSSLRSNPDESGSSLRYDWLYLRVASRGSLDFRYEVLITDHCSLFSGYFLFHFF